jgi:hypothetical protein
MSDFAPGWSSAEGPVRLSRDGCASHPRRRHQPAPPNCLGRGSQGARAVAPRAFGERRPWGWAGPRKGTTLVSKAVESRFVELDQSGPPNLGDEFISQSTFTDQQGNPMGESAVVCAVVSKQGHGDGQLRGDAVAAAWADHSPDPLRGPHVCRRGGRGTGDYQTRAATPRSTR